MFDIHRVEIDWGGRKLKLETGHIARQADAAVLAQYGETTVLATVVGARSVKSPASTSSRSPSTTKNALMPPVKSQAGTSSAKAARLKKKP